MVAQLLEAECVLRALKLKQDVVLQPTQAKVALRKEVARPGRRVEDRDTANLLVQLLEGTGSGSAGDGLGTRLGKLVSEVVEEQRVNDLVDVLGACEVLAVGSPVVMRQGPLEDRAKDRGAYARPIELLAPLNDERVPKRLGQGGGSQCVRGRARRSCREGA